MTYPVRLILLCGTAPRVLSPAFVTRPFGPVFHRAAARDALGLVRLLWAVEQGRAFGPEEDDLNAHFERMNLLTETGKVLVRCLDLGRGVPDTVGGRAALVQPTAAMDALVAAVQIRSYTSHALG